jgi:hypothetical protein
VNFPDADDRTAYYPDNLEDAINAAVEWSESAHCQPCGQVRDGQRHDQIRETGLVRRIFSVAEAAAPSARIASSYESASKMNRTSWLYGDRAIDPDIAPAPRDAAAIVSRLMRVTPIWQSVRSAPAGDRIPRVGKGC